MDRETTNLASTAPKPFVFVLMPFEDSFSDVYKLGIRAACEIAGAYCERVDEQLFEESILQRIYNQIAKADLIIADMTSRNPNVFYEVGYAHALGKPVILLTQQADDIPFDLKHFPHIVYGGHIAELISALQSRVQWHLQNRDGRPEIIPASLAFYFGGVELTDNATLSVQVDPSSVVAVLVVDYGVWNVSDVPYRGQSQEIALIVPRGLHLASTEEFETLPSVALPDGRTLYTFGPLETILPQAWSTVSVRLTASTGSALAGQAFSIVARHFTEFGPRDIEVRLEFVDGRPPRFRNVVHYQPLKVLFESAEPISLSRTHSSVALESSSPTLPNEPRGMNNPRKTREE